MTSIPGTVLALLSPREASRYRVVPFAAVGGRADVATDRPDAFEELDELSFLLGKRLVVHITTEVRLAEALERCYGIARPARLSELIARLSGPPRPAPTPAASPPAQESPPELYPPGAPMWHEEEARPSIITSRFRPLTPVVPPDPPRVIPLTPEERRALGESVRAAPSPGVRLLEDALGRLQVATSARQVGQTLLETLSGDYTWVALFRARHDEWAGWLGTGPGLSTDRLRSCELRASEPSVVLELQPGLDLWSGVLAPLPAHARIAAAWGGSLEGEFTVAGMRLRDRLVCIAIARRASDRPRGLDDQALRQLFAAAGQSFETLLTGER